MRVSISVALFACLITGNALSQMESERKPVNCPSLDVKGDSPLHKVSLPPSDRCSPSNKNGFPIPDPNCTPGAINPSITLEVLKNPNFKTGCVRDEATNPQIKDGTYKWYHLQKPPHNSGQAQVCELDHLISLEIGGADTLDNIWPQCGPSRAALDERYFKRKDTVENYLAKQVREGKMNLSDAQSGIATDWTQYLETAERECPKGECK